MVKGRLADPGSAVLWGLGFVFFLASSWASYARWANFEYRTFDLAYYVQGLWQLIHGRFAGSILGVPLLGNHVEPIIFLMTPFFMVWPHPMMLVLVQNALLGSMGPLAFGIGRRLGLNGTSALLLAAALLVTPATAYVALHEFHPEALTAPCLLLMIAARLRNSLKMHWVAALALLACKENMALILAAYCAVHLVLERRRPAAELRNWYIWPFVLAVVWLLLCAKVITPALNSGAIDYLALYDRLGTSAGAVFTNVIREPWRIGSALSHSLQNGNLIWGLLLPFLGLPLLRPRWLLIGTPILLQHLLSWRSSEWQIYFHYAAPLVPLFWMALAEAVGGIERGPQVGSWIRGKIPFLILAGCLVAQFFLGPAATVWTEIQNWPAGRDERARKIAFLNQIAPASSVVAPLPYLSHLAMREKLYSLHHILKGLKTLSRTAYDPPPPTDLVLIDYDDTATFDSASGYYHPAMKTVDGRVIPSSDRLLHDFLKRASWAVDSSNELALFRQIASAPESVAASTNSEVRIEIDPQTILTSVTKNSDRLTQQGIDVTTEWYFQEPRNVFPWMRLNLTPASGGTTIVIQKGLCAPERESGPFQEKWHLVPSSRIPPGDYSAEVFFLDNSKLLWAERFESGNARPPVAAIRVPLGELKVGVGNPSAN